MSAHVVDDSSGGVKSRLLPLSPTDALMERIVEMLPRRQVWARLVPARDIVVVDDVRGDFKAVGGNPCFDLILDLPPHRGVWLYIEGALVRNSGSRVASLDGDAAVVGAPDLHWPITTNLRGTIREVVFLPPGIQALRWTPTGAPGFFTQSPLLVHVIGQLESGARRLHRVLLHWGRLCRPPSGAGDALSLWGALTNLQSAYRRTADLRESHLRGGDYRMIVARDERLAREESAVLLSRLRSIPAPPFFTLLVQPCNSSVPRLLEMVRAVCTQTYPHWELCLAESEPPHASVAAVAGCAGALASRMRWLDRAERATVDELHGQATTRAHYVLFIGQDDLLHANALLHLALAVADEVAPDLVYGDDDQLDAAGRRFAPRFKPDWNPDLLLSCNYVGSMFAVRVDHVNRMDLLGQSGDGARPYWALLRLCLALPALRVRHIARVLHSQRAASPVHWVSASGDEPDIAWRAHCAGLAILNKQIAAFGATAEDGFANGYYRVFHPVPEPRLLVSLIIPTRDRPDLLRACVESVRALTDYPAWEMLVVDNGSRDSEALAYMASLEMDSRIRVLRYDCVFNYSALNNFAARAARGQVLGLLNNDLEVRSCGWLTEMVSHATRPAIGAVGAKLLYPDGMVQHAGVVLGIGGVAGHVHKFLPGDAPGYCGRANVVQNLSAVTGACLVVRASSYWQVGGLDETHLGVAFNDIDFCLKLREAGYRNLYTPHALLFHHESISRGRDDTREKRRVFREEFAYMQATWSDKLKSDPAYNVNLTLEFGDFSLANTDWKPLAYG